MKIYGSGVFRLPSSARVIWDFKDGPFDCVNPVLITEARRQGLSFSPPDKAVIVTPIDTPKKRGRKPREAKNVNAKTHRTD